MPLEESIQHTARKYGLTVHVVRRGYGDGPDYIDIITMQVPEPSQRGKGRGSQFLTVICADADRQNEIIGLCPEGKTSEDTARLIRWYKRYGFEENVDTDTYRVSFIRQPAQQRSDRSC